MRWWIGILAVLFLAGVSLMVFRGRAPTVGEKLLGELERQNGGMRGAIPLLEYTPVEDGGAGELRSGVGGPLEGISPVLNQRWIRTKDADFVWKRVLGEAGGAAGEEMLRASIAGAARVEVGRALAAQGNSEDVTGAMLDRAEADLGGLSDEELLLRWLAADRGMMLETEDEGRAVREALLLVARDNGGPAVLFSVGRYRVYLLPMDGPAGKDSSTVWTQMEGYEDGRLAWTGVLSMEGSPGADAVRRMAARMAAEAVKPRAMFR